MPPIKLFGWKFPQGCKWKQPIEGLFYIPVVMMEGEKGIVFRNTDKRKSIYTQMHGQMHLFDEKVNSNWYVVFTGNALGLCNCFGVSVQCSSMKVSVDKHSELKSRGILLRVGDICLYLEALFFSVPAHCRLWLNDLLYSFVCNLIRTTWITVCWISLYNAGIWVEYGHFSSVVFDKTCFCFLFCCVCSVHFITGR